MGRRGLFGGKLKKKNPRNSPRADGPGEMPKKGGGERKGEVGFK